MKKVELKSVKKAYVKWFSNVLLLFFYFYILLLKERKKKGIWGYIRDAPLVSKHMSRRAIVCVWLTAKLTWGRKDNVNKQAPRNSAGLLLVLDWAVRWCWSERHKHTKMTLCIFIIPNNCDDTKSFQRLYDDDGVVVLSLSHLLCCVTATLRPLLSPSISDGIVREPYFFLLIQFSFCLWSVFVFAETGSIVLEPKNTKCKFLHFEYWFCSQKWGLVIHKIDQHAVAENLQFNFS